VGVVGPASLAVPVQKRFHKMIGADRPMGWDHQLPNEPVLNVDYTGAYLLAKGDWSRSLSWRVVPVVNAVDGGGRAGAVFRDSHSVDTKPSVGMATIGLNARQGNFVGFLGLTRVTQAFAGERKRADFGTASVSWVH